jgi:uncharacterized protein YeaO (DUF488 family)
VTWRWGDRTHPEHAWSIIAVVRCWPRGLRKDQMLNLTLASCPITFSEEASWHDRTRRDHVRSLMMYAGVSISGARGRAE